MAVSWSTTLVLYGLAIAAGATSSKTTLVLFHTTWCSTLCEETASAVADVKSSLEENDLTKDYEVRIVDCGSAVHSSACCRHDIDTYPTIHVMPAGSDKYWVYQGERSFSVMYETLLHDKSPKAMVSLSASSGLSCAAAAIRYTTAHFVTRTISGSAILGALIGGLVVYIYVAMRTLKFGSRRGDFAVLAGTFVVTYFIVR